MYIGNTQHTFKKIINGHFSDLLHLLKNGQIPDSFSAHFEQHFKSTTSHTYLQKCMPLNSVKKLIPIGAIKKYTKPNCKICMEERLTILKKVRDKHVTVMNKNSEMYGDFWHKTTFH